ncbi:MAG: hypothetical protein RIQ59_655 [Bacteroidota bacterium]|jgi:uncharacterized protein (TIGR01777 family)
MKILITGATGLIGQELTNLLLQEEHIVHYLTTRPFKSHRRHNYFGFSWNPKAGKIDENCLIGVDVIIHLAGASISQKWTPQYKKELVESRIQSAELLFQLLSNNPNQVKLFISASGTAIYPDSDSAIYDEEANASDRSFLGQLVEKWEASADQFKLLNIKVTKMRTGIVFSNKKGALREMIKPIKMFVGTGFGNGKQLQSWIHIKDIARLYSFVIQNQIEGIVNSVAPIPVSNQELTNIIAKRLHRPLFLPNLPKSLMKFILGDMHILLFNNKNVVPKKALNSGFQFDYPTAELALSNLIK